YFPLSPFLILFTLCLFSLLHACVAPRALHSFPTRRSSDLSRGPLSLFQGRSTMSRSRTRTTTMAAMVRLHTHRGTFTDFLIVDRDRKSTRLNSSHVSISYAVFCLKKKNNSILQPAVVS